MTKKNKTLLEATNELKASYNRFSKAKKHFMRAYENSLSNFGMEQYPITFDHTIESLPKKMVEDEMWN